MYRFKRFTEKANAALNLAIEAAREMGHTYIGTEHLLLGLLREGTGVAAVVLASRGITVLRYTEKILAGEGGGCYSPLTPEDFTPRAKAAMESALTDAAMSQQRLAGTEHILAAILRDDTSVAVRLLQSMEGRPGELLSDISRTTGPSAQPRTTPKTGRTPTLEQYSRDLTRLARDGRLDPVIGRETELQRLIQILCRRTKNNPCLIGEPGVGKTAVAEALAQKIADDEVPQALRGKRLLSLDLTGMVAGTKYRGDFEERVKNVIAEVTKAGDALLFIDELHNLMGAGAAEGAVDAANILKPVLARGELQLIGATTVSEYRRHIEKDAALERRFQPITIKEPSAAQALDILRGLRSRYEAHHRVLLPEDTLQAAIRLAERYIPERFLPDKAVDVLDEAAARVRLLADAAEGQTALTSDSPKKPPTVTEEDVATVVASWTGIPVERVGQEESLRLRSLEDTLHHRLVGQEEAVSAVAKAVRRSRVGLQEPHRPVGSFIFLGPTGVGKTELCKALAEALFGEEKAMIRLDMSEYMEPHAVARLIGAPPGYVGHEEGGQLTEQVRRHPYTVVLLDEIEKAHPDVFNLLLQILEDGRLTDSNGRHVDFRHTLLIMTSNVGGRRLAGEGRLGFGDSPEDRRQAAMGELKKLFRPEFLNRVDDTIVFHTLNNEQIQAIVRRMLDGLQARLEALGYGWQADPAAVDVLAKAGYDPVYGARPLRRAIQSRVEDPLAERLLAGDYRKGDTVCIEVENGELVFGRR